MDSKIQRHILDYFTYLENVYTTFKCKMLDCQKVTLKLFTLMERQKRLKKANIIDTPLEKFRNIVRQLMFQIDQKINRHVYELQNHSHEMEKMHEILERKRIALDKSCEQINFREKSTLTNGSAFQPRLSDLLELSQDGVMFSLGVCAQVKYVISSVSLNGSRCESTDIINESFKLEYFTEKRIKEILMLTQFCNKNEIPS